LEEKEAERLLEKENLKIMERRYQRLAESDFLTFIEGIEIPSATGPQLFHDCVFPFQREFFDSISPSLKAIQTGNKPEKRRFWVERTKGASKDADLALCVLWVLAFAHCPTYCQVGAADRDQAAILRSRIKNILHYNEWLDKHVVIQQNKVQSRNGLASLDIMASDSRSAHGGTPDLLILNELVHVDRWEFAETLMSNAAKVPYGVVVIATNAGYKGTMAEKWKENAMKDHRWHTYILDEPAPWIAEEDVQDEMKRLPPSAAKRLWLGKWPSGKGDALTEEDINRVFSARIRPLLAPEQGWRYIAAMDLGVSHDHSGLVVLGVNQPDQRLRIVQMQDWAPNPNTGEVDLIEVENTCFAMSQLFNISWFGYDPTQAKLMAQRLSRRGVPMQEVSFSSPKNLTEMAQALVQVTNSGKLECYEDETLRRDLGKLHIVEKSYGYRLEAVSDQHGHADVGTALVICLPTALSMLAAGGFVLPDDYQFVLDEGPLTDKEVKEMPDVLKGIYEMEPVETMRRRDLLDAD
jgi:phage terminase large subunit-like protein